MRDETLVDVVTRLMVASGREAAEIDYTIWREALADLDDALAVQASKELVAEIDLVLHRPSPAMVRGQVRAIRARQTATLPGIPAETSRVASEETNLAWVAEIRARLAAAKGPLVVDLRRSVDHPSREPHSG